MTARMLDPADAELEEAVAHYTAISPDLGERFRREMDRTIVNILDYPKRWPHISGVYRKCSLTGFPYRLIYRFDEQELVVVAVMHTGRDPNYWKGRE